MPDWVIQLAGMAGSAAAVYAGIRADIRGLHERVERALAASEKAHSRIDGAHERIDGILQQQRVRGARNG
jgi:hypothetical protein